jgi:hypothetical protein
MVADNDLTLGRVAEAITKSRFWKESAIFILVRREASDRPSRTFCDISRSAPSHHLPRVFAARRMGTQGCHMQMRLEAAWFASLKHARASTEENNDNGGEDASDRH